MESVNFANLNLGVSSGDLNFSNTQVGNRLDIKLSSGSIMGRDIRANVSKMEVQSGDLEAYIDCKDLDLSISSGWMLWHNETAPEKRRAVGRSGDCTVAIPENDGLSLDYRVSSGDFENEFGTGSDWGHGSGNTSYGNQSAGRNYQIDVSSGFLKFAKR